MTLPPELTARIKGIDDLLAAVILGKTPLSYIVTQFPAAEGHRPLTEYFDKINQARILLGQLAEPLHKEIEELREKLRTTDLVRQNAQHSANLWQQSAEMRAQEIESLRQQLAEANERVLLFEKLSVERGRSRISRLGVVSAMRSLEQQKLATSFRHGDDQWASLMWALNEENPMPTESLTDQLRLLEEEIAKIEASGVPLPYTQTLLTVAKGLESRLNEVTSASTQQHLAAADRTSSELAALRAENERQKELFVTAVASEPELPGPMPDEMWEAIQGDRDAIQEALRISVRMTKQGILDRLASLSK